MGLHRIFSELKQRGITLVHSKDKIWYIGKWEAHFIYVELQNKQSGQFQKFNKKQGERGGVEIKVYNKLHNGTGISIRSKKQWKQTLKLYTL